MVVTIDPDAAATLCCESLSNKNKYLKVFYTPVSNALKYAGVKLFKSNIDCTSAARLSFSTFLWNDKTD